MFLSPITLYNTYTLVYCLVLLSMKPKLKKYKLRV